MYDVSYYDYETLKAAALADGATEEDIDALGEWFRLYGEVFWNGEYYDVEGWRLYPFYVDDGYNYNIVGYYLR